MGKRGLPLTLRTSPREVPLQLSSWACIATHVCKVEAMRDVPCPSWFPVLTACLELDYMNGNG